LRTFVQGLGYSLAPGETDDNAVSAVEAFRPKTNPAFDEVR